MTGTWKKLERMPAGREATLGNALRAWMELNGVNIHEAAAFLQESGVKGSAKNIHSWMNNDPAGELFSAQTKALLAATGIQADPIIVAAAKEAAIAKDATLEQVISFDTLCTRAEILTRLSEIVESYSGNAKLVARVIGIHDRSICAWKGGSHLPAGDNLERLVVALSRGVFPATCQEDYHLFHLCREMFGLPTDAVFPGITRFEHVLDALAKELGDTNSGPEKIRVYGMSVNAANQMRKWLPCENKLPMESVTRVVRALVSLRYPQTLSAYDERAKELIETDEVREKIALDGTVPARKSPRTVAPAKAVAPAKEIVPDPVRPVEAAIPEPERALDPSPAPIDDAFLARLKAGVPHLRALVDVLDPEGAKPKERTFESTLGETVDGMRNCLGESGFPNFPDGTASPEAVAKFMEAYALFRGMLLALSGIPEAERVKVRNALRGTVEETILLEYGVFRYDDTSAAFRIIKGNLDMGRKERRSATTTTSRSR